MPIDIRAYHAVLTFLLGCNQDGWVKTCGRLVASACLWVMRVSWKAYTFCKWITSRKVSAEILKGRTIVCDGCDASRKTNGALYCGLCGCPDWNMSRLSVKNARKGHNCPLGKHEGSFATMTLNSKKCKGCGNGEAPRQTTIIQGGSVLDLAREASLIRLGKVKR